MRSVVLCDTPQKRVSCYHNIFLSIDYNSKINIHSCDVRVKNDQGFMINIDLTTSSLHEMHSRFLFFGKLCVRFRHFVFLRNTSSFNFRNNFVSIVLHSLALSNKRKLFICALIK